MPLHEAPHPLLVSFLNLIIPRILLKDTILKFIEDASCGGELILDPIFGYVESGDLFYGGVRILAR